MLDRLIADAWAGRSGALVLRGEAGVGKTALLDYLVVHAAACRVVRASGVESEMELAFAGVHQLCVPFLDRLDQLAAPQRDALQTAFGLREGQPPDRFLLGLAVLSLLSGVAETQPLICLVDDAQWLDQASTQVLGFVARRLAAEAVVIIFAIREPTDDEVLVGLPALTVRALHDADARALLATALPGRLDAAVVERIIVEARGNPLALLELPRAWTPAAFAGGFGLPDSISVAGRIEESFRRRLARLPADTKRLLLVAAAEPTGDTALIRTAAERLRVRSDAADPATTEGLLDTGAEIRFRHPLVRSVIYRDAAAEDRRLVHAALADATDPAFARDRRAWHLAAAAPGPDDDLALELEHVADQARARGGVAAAAAFLQRAASLTRDRSRRAQRALAAAQASLHAGAFDAAVDLVATAQAEPLDESQRALIDLIRARLAFAASRGNDATPLLLAAAQRLEPLNLRLARETYLDAFSAALFGARLNQGLGVREVAAVARVSDRPSPEEATAADVMLDALVALADDYESGIAPSRDALRRLAADKISSDERLRWLWQGTVVALEVWDDELAFTLSQQNAQIAREAGTLTELSLALSAHTPVLVFCGDLYSAASAVAETQSVEEATGIASAPYGALILAAWQGNASKTRELIDSSIRDATFRGEGIGVAVAEYARAVLCNGLGEYDEALIAASSASQYQEAVVENWALSELVEPATRTGRRELAIRAVDRLAIKASAAGTGWARGIALRSRALVSPDDEADALFRKAIEHLTATRVLSELGRTHLVYGEHLRRTNRRVDARRELNAAHEMFSAMGMATFAERARRELLATGEKVRRRNVATRNDLTPQEEQIARLAGDGHSNPEISARLFLSPRTVEWHLHKVFGKLGVSSRKELRRALSIGIGTPIGA